MKIIEFDYTKQKTGEKSQRKIMLLHNTKDYIDAIDLSKLSKEEIKEMFKAQKIYEDNMDSFFKKGFRRFSKSGMKVLNEDEIKTQS